MIGLWKNILLKTALVGLFSLYSTVYYGQEGFARSEDVNIYFRTFGEGQPVLIINGGPGFNSQGFEGVASEIADMGYRTILYDQRGTGRSQMKTLDSLTITMDLMVKDIEAVRKKLGYEEWVVLGHSFGGMMANYYASKHPDRVRGIIASSSGGMDLALLGNAGREILSRLTEQEQDSLSYYREMMRSGENREEARRKHAQFMALAYVFNKEHVSVVAERLIQGNMELNHLVWNDLRRIEYDTKESLKNFSKPVLIIQGKQDIVSKELAYTADSVLPESQLIFLKNSSHYGWLDQPHKYYRTLEKFLRMVHGVPQ